MRGKSTFLWLLAGSGYYVTVLSSVPGGTPALRRLAVEFPNMRIIGPEIVGRRGEFVWLDDLEET